MSARIVVDASALMRASVRFGSTEYAVRAIEEADAIAPDIVSIEVANALWRYVRASEMSLAAAEKVLSAACAVVPTVPVSSDLLTAALRLACDARHPVYDCIYLALALREQRGLLTADLKLAGLARAKQIATQLLP